MLYAVGCDIPNFKLYVDCKEFLQNRREGEGGGCSDLYLVLDVVGFDIPSFKYFVSKKRYDLPN